MLTPGFGTPSSIPGLALFARPLTVKRARLLLGFLTSPQYTLAVAALFYLCWAK